MRPIDADALKYKQQVMYKKGDSDEVYAEWFITATEIANAPTIDAVPVTRCIECKYMEIKGTKNRFCFCDKWYSPINQFDFCSFGER